MFLHRNCRGLIMGSVRRKTVNTVATKDIFRCLRFPPRRFFISQKISFLWHYVFAVVRSYYRMIWNSIYLDLICWYVNVVTNTMMYKYFLYSILVEEHIYICIYETSRNSVSLVTLICSIFALPINSEKSKNIDQHK